MFFYVFTFCDQFVASEFVIADATAVFLNNQHGIQRRGQDFDKTFVYEGVHSKEVGRRISREKLNKATKLGVNKLLKRLRDTCTVDRRPGSSRLRSAHTEENVETVNDLVLSQEDKPRDPQHCP